eukprot:CAMPEP_0181066466 /NCGR_PEP_ID=MMETSP1070-20121207/25342_1 /TAXON_ID=265543 /ORGANISM="Minutocellus polymorphus, Strain NH13" /LENGTH=1404 /DNA_ID=CAMNT_0023147035 /DNA_START=41 /DNA_END=4255 /DNA_ORIENTATION=-
MQTPMSRRSSKRKKRRPVQPSGVLGGRQKIVLEDIGGSHAADSEFTLDYHSPGTPWTKVILLEELGTASSWLVLLLPYISFLVALALDSTSVLQEMTLDPRSGARPCTGVTNETEIFPLTPIPPTSCSYPYRIQEGAGLLSYVNARNAIVDRRYEFFLSSGAAVTSGPIKDVPAMSSFLYGDMTFTGLSNDAVALVTKGSVLTSTAVFQRRIDGDDDVNNGRRLSNKNDEEWFPVSISEPKRLDMVCKYYTKKSNWNCTAPQTIDVLFSLPATAVLTGGDIRVDTIFSYYPLRPYDSWSRRLTNKSDNDLTADDILSGSDTSNPHSLLVELSSTSAYILRHQRPAYAETIVIVRLVSLTISFCFLIYWVTTIGFVGFCCNRGNELFHDDQEDSDDESDCCIGFSCERWEVKEEDGLVKKKEKHRNLNWWESPWIVMPERRYLLILLICLLMVQNPLLAVAFYRPKLFSSAQMHVAADCLIGIGVHTILMMTACLMQGLRYHTASFNRKRAKQQRKVLELAKTANHLAREGHPYYGSDMPASSYAAAFYERYGDTDGAAFAGALHSRLRHDPCGSQWADFLLPKFALLIIGIVCVVLGAMSRFPGKIAIGHQSRQYINANTATLDSDTLAIYKTIYVVSSFGQLSVLLGWGLLILMNTVNTGRRLKKEPFLSTRPTQLAYRVLTGILFLGFMALLVPFLLELLIAIAKWLGIDNHHANYQVNQSDIIHHTSSGYLGYDSQVSPLEVLVSVVVHATSRFPYSGTAASIGPGKILYVTVCSLVASFIFLPASPGNDLIESETSPIHRSAKTIDRELQKSDKRQVVTLAKYTHSWRVFPLPIERKSVLHHQPVPSKVLPPDAFELDIDGMPREASFRRGTIYRGRYMPVFCLETACWLLEAAWQAYYSHDQFKTDDDWAPGRMSLDSVGLKLDAAISDDRSDTKAYICSNVKPQVDGEEGSVIVVAFRGTASKKNMKTDLNWQQVPLPEDIEGRDGRADYQVRVGSEPSDNPDETSTSSGSHPLVTLIKPRRLEANFFTPGNLLKATPIVRQATPLVHEGFLEAYLHIRDQVLESVLNIFQSQLENSLRMSRSRRSRRGYQEGIFSSCLHIPKIYITGHSLGGSLAQLLALDLACNCEIIVEQLAYAHGESRHNDSPFQAQVERVGEAVIGASRKRSVTLTDESLRPAYQSADVSPSFAQPDREQSFNSTPRLKRRNSFGNQREINTRKRASSSDFLHSLFSGEAFNRRKRKTRLQPPIAVYTFGQPRLGNRAFTRLYKQRVPHTFRLVNEGDPITGLPVATCGGFYKHAGLEVALDEGCTGNILVGPTVVETMFRFSKVRTNMGAHSMEQYRDNLESALSIEELHEYYAGHGGDKSDAAAGLGRGSSRQGLQSLPGWVTSVKRSIID